jgi:hypothetical protein
MRPLRVSSHSCVIGGAPLSGTLIWPKTLCRHSVSMPALPAARCLRSRTSIASRQLFVAARSAEDGWWPWATSFERLGRVISKSGRGLRKPCVTDETTAYPQSGSRSLNRSFRPSCTLRLEFMERRSLNKGPDFSVERMAAGGAGLQIRASVARRHRSPRRPAI